MRRMNKIWQRVMALTLALIMVLANVPSGVFADTDVATPNEKEIVLLAASLTASPNYAPEEPEQPAETPDPEQPAETPDPEQPAETPDPEQPKDDTEGTDPVAPANEEEPAEREIISYNYELKVWNSNNEDLQDEYEVATKLNGLSIFGAEFYSNIGVDKTLELAVSYQGLTLNLSSAEVVDGSVTKSIAYKYMDLHLATQYTELVLAAPVLVENTGWTPAENMGWRFVEGEKYADCVGTFGEGDAKSYYKATADKVTLGSFVFSIGDNLVEEFKIPYDAKITAPKIETKYEGAENDKWTTGPVSVEVISTSSEELAVIPTEILPEVKAEPDASISEWETEDYTVFKKFVTLEESAVVTVGEEKLNVLIDNVEPGIKDVDSYLIEDEKGTKTVVTFAVSVGESGIADVSINGKSIEKYDYDEKKGKIEIVYEGKLEGNFSLAVTSNAGLTGLFKDAKEPLGLMDIEIETPKVIGERDVFSYIPKENEFTIRVNNPHGKIDPKVTDAIGNPLEVEWKDNVGTFKLASGKTMKGMIVTVIDEIGRKEQAAFTTIYRVDDTAPVITLTGLETTELTYTKEQQKYTVTIEDDAILGTMYGAKFTYEKDGETSSENIFFTSEANGNIVSGSFTLTDGMHLTSVEVKAENATGLPANETFERNVVVDEKNPVIEASISAVDAGEKAVTVKNFYKNDAGKWFAILEPVETNEVDGTVSLTVTFTLNEANPDADALAENGWEYNETSGWTKVVKKDVTENTSDAIEFSVTAKDLAGRVPSSTLSIRGEDENSFVISLEPKEGVYSGKIAIDRCAPGTGRDGENAPVVELNSPEAVTKVGENKDVDLYNDAFNYTLTVNDGDTDNDSGIKSVEWKLSDNAKELLSCGAGKATQLDGEITIPVEVSGIGELNDIILTVTVTDNVGNQFIKVEQFAFDNMAPRITISYTDDGKCHNGNYFDDSRTAIITYEDLNLDLMNICYAIDSNAWQSATEEQTIPYIPDGHHTLGVKASDLAGHVTSADRETELVDNSYVIIGEDVVAPFDFYIDTQKPVISIVQKSEDTTPNTDGNTDYYNKSVTYTISATDDHMMTAYAKYSKITPDGETDIKEIPLMSEETEIVIGNGEVLTELKVYACDYADRTTDLVTSLSFEDPENDGEYSFTRVIAVDTTPASVTMEKTVAEKTDFVRSLNNVDYYNGEVTYKLTVTDRFDFNIGTKIFEIVYNGTAKTVALEKDDKNSTDILAVYTAEFTVEAGSDLSKMDIEIKDNAGNVSEGIDVENAPRTYFFYNAGILSYTGCRVVVDNVAPKAELLLSENVTAIYTKEGSEVIYLKLSETATGLSGAKAEQAEQTATIKVKVTDKNIILATEDTEANEAKNGRVTTISGDGKWTGTPKVNDSDSELVYEQEITVAADNAGVFAFELSVFDMAGNTIDANELDIKCSKNGEYSNVTTIPVSEGKFGATISVDRRRPTSEAWTDNVPSIDITPSITPTTANNGVELFSEAFSFGLEVTDGALNAENSGIDTVKWNITDPNGFVEETEKVTEIKAEQESYAFEIPVDIAQKPGESNDVKLNIEITDNVGNITTYEKLFAVDTLAPRITVEYDNDEVNNKMYFQAARTAVVTVEDINFNAEATIINTNGTLVEGWKQNESAWTCKYTFAEQGEYTFAIESTDKAANTTEDKNVAYSEVAPRAFVVDLEDPVVTVTQKTDATYVGTHESTDYYNNVVSYSISVADEYMDDGLEGVEAWVKYTLIDNSGKEATKQVTIDPAGITIEINDGEVLSDLRVFARDNAARTTEMNTELNFEEVPAAEEENADPAGTYSFTRDSAVDMTPASVELTKEGSYNRTYEGTDYYASAVTYKLQITDRFELFVGEMIFKAVIDGEEKVYEIKKNEEASDLDATVYTAEFKVEDGSELSAMSILVMDNAGNFTKEIKVNETEENLTFFECKNNENVYGGNLVVSDMTAPVVELALSENVAAIYTNKNTGSNVIYLELKETATGNSGENAKEEEQTAEITVTVKDKNIILVEDSVETFEGDGKWSGAPEVNRESTLTYKQSITVKADETGAFKFELSAVDMAGNPVAAENLTLKCGEGDAYTSADISVSDGAFGTTISVDRRRPTTENWDNNAPVISIKPIDIVPTVSSNDKDLFNKEFTFELTVTDGTADENNSGIRTVDWVIEDAVGFVVGTNVVNKQSSDTYTQKFDIPVTVNGIGESNDAKVTITSIDNVGNITTYTKEFAVDTQAPRIDVVYSNNDVRNEKYFKAVRTATIKVEDINFNPATTVINTEVTPSEWVQDGSVWTCYCAYNTDGEYTFSMESTDLANNHTAEVDYNGSAAPQDFVIDMTAPVIEVSYNPSSFIGEDNEGVRYYNEALRATVSIREVNFNAADVVAKFNSKHTLSGFSGTGSVHNASVTFDEGNRYNFSIEYTDLAGNPAAPFNSPIFSVDQTAPEIKITAGEAEPGELYIVQDDLTLAFAITDAQSNLKSYTVKVVHLNNEFQTNEVKDGYYQVYSADERSQINVDFVNFAKEKGNDGIYTIEIKAQDYANNSTDLSPKLVLSLNRFGSSFYTDDSFTQNFLSPSDDGVVYQQSVGQKLIFKELNPNNVKHEGGEGSMITVMVNGTTKVLTEGVDYVMKLDTQGEGSSKWYLYTYEIDPKVFFTGSDVVNGKYSLLFYSEDAAGNKNTNEANGFAGAAGAEAGDYSGKVEFTLDNTAPIISIVGIENNGSYNAANQKMNIFISDNTPLNIFATLNDTDIMLSETAGADDAAWLIWDALEGCYVLNVPEQNSLFGHQNVTINVTDAAGNNAMSEVVDFTVSSNAIVRFVNSMWFWISGGALVLAILAAIVLLKKKKNGAAA